MKLFSFILLALSIALSVSAGEVKERKARNNDRAERYILDENGNFYRTVKVTRQGKEKEIKCSITNRVEDFKVSQHPNDEAVVYFIRESDLYVLHNAEGETNDCPTASKKVILNGVKKINGEYRYHVVSSIHTTVVNTALDSWGNFVAWDNKQAVAFFKNIEDYRLNQTYGTDKAFNSYVAFLYKLTQQVIKLKGLDPASSKETSEKYGSLKEFVEKVVSPQVK